MEWRDLTDKISTCKPYRIELIGKKWNLYKSEVIEGRWSMRLISKHEFLEDAKKAAEEDSKQKTIWG